MLRRLGSLLALDDESQPATDSPHLTELMLRAKEQIEYYLSAVNLDRDDFMRSQIQSTPEGLIPASHRRIGSHSGIRVSDKLQLTMES
jgi:hypothetical protein